ncbi:hypothetical protein D3C78_1562320 [compost metagenome]
MNRQRFFIIVWRAVPFHHGRLMRIGFFHILFAFETWVGCRHFDAIGENKHIPARKGQAETETVWNGA